MPDLAGKKVGYLGYTGTLDSNGVQRIAAALNSAVNGGYEEVHLCFSSMGGFVADGVYLYNHLRGLPIHVVAHNMGSVSSIAVAAFVGADERYCSAYSMFLIHPTTIGGAEVMAAERLQSALDAALADDERTESILRERTSLPDELLHARRRKDVNITPDLALKHGLVHGIKEFTLPKGNEIIQV